MENQLEKKMENEMETVVIKGMHRDPSIQKVEDSQLWRCRHARRRIYSPPEVDRVWGIWGSY